MRLVLVAKIFELKEPMELALIARKLKAFNEEEPYKSDQKVKKLSAEILEPKLDATSFLAIFSKDFVISRYYKRGLVETVVTEETPFWIKKHKDRTSFISLAPSKARGIKKLLTNYVANKLSDILFIKTGAIVETSITHETLKELHESNPHATKLVWFDQVNIPNVGKLALAGMGLADQALPRLPGARQDLVRGLRGGQARAHCGHHKEFSGDPLQQVNRRRVHQLHRRR